MSTFRSESTRSVLKCASLALLVAMFPLTACDSLGGGQDPTASGSWVGSFTIVGAEQLGTVPLSLSLTEREGGVLEGSGAFKPGDNEVPVVFSGQHAFPSISGRLILGGGAMDLTATMDSDGEVIDGRLTEGEVTATLTLNRR